MAPAPRRTEPLAFFKHGLGAKELEAIAKTTQDIGMIEGQLKSLKHSMEALKKII